MTNICDFITCLEAQNDPLSADVFFIRGNKGTYIYDVGSNDGAYSAIKSCEGEKTVILSHFHPDHTKNMSRLEIEDYFKLYLGRQTYKKLGMGEIVDSEAVINDGIELIIRRCPSVHAKGSLILTVNRKYTFLGDLCYPVGDINLDLAREMPAFLKKIDTEFFIESHQSEDKRVVPKDEFLSRLKEHYSL